MRGQTKCTRFSHFHLHQEFFAYFIFSNAAGIPGDLMGLVFHVPVFPPYCCFFTGSGKVRATAQTTALMSW